MPQIDGDGSVDIYTSNAAGVNEMYLNSIDKPVQFEKVAVTQRSYGSFGIATTDFNNDGFVEKHNPSYKLRPPVSPTRVGCAAPEG